MKLHGRFLSKLCFGVLLCSPCVLEAAKDNANSKDSRCKKLAVMVVERNVSIGLPAKGKEPAQVIGPVTGEIGSPTPELLLRLGLQDWIRSPFLERYDLSTTIAQARDQPIESFRGKKVVSIGEGYSGLVPYLRSQGVDAIGIDPIYGMKLPASLTTPMIEAYYKKWSSFLMDANATDLKGIEANSVDMILGSQVYYFMEEQNILIPAFLEALRVLKPGGSLRVNGRINTLTLMLFGGKISAAANKRGYQFKSVFREGTFRAALKNPAADDHRLVSFTKEEWEVLDPDSKLIRAWDRDMAKKHDVGRDGYLVVTKIR